MQQAVIFSSPHLNAIRWFIHVYVSSHTGPCNGAAGRIAPGKPLCGSFRTQPPDIAGRMSPPSVLVDQLVEPPGSPMCSQKECPTKFETR